MVKQKKDRFMGKLYVTIDTEMDADIHWNKSYPGQFTSVLEGIPVLLRPIWDKYRINPIYFVSPEVAESRQCCRVLKREIMRGAVIGAHLHPEYIEPCKKDASQHAPAEFPCSAYDKDMEKAKLYNLTKLIENNLGVRPEWYRAARFGADRDTIDILNELGYKYDSSFTPCIDWSSKGGPNHKYAPLDSYFIDPKNIYTNNAGKSDGIKEFPVTIMGKRWGAVGRLLPDNWLFYRWIRPSHMTYLEQRKMVRQLRAKGIDNIVMMFHSMEIMVGKTPYVRNKVMQRYYMWRLEKTIKFAINMGYTGDI